MSTPVQREPGLSLNRPEGLERTVRGLLSRPGAPRAGLVLALLAAALFLFLDGRGQTFWYDEWAFVLDRRGGDLGTFLEPHNGHLSLLPVVAYKALLAVAGMDHYWPYRLTVIALHLICVALIYVYAERRVGGWLALAAAIPMLFLGPAWQVIVWPFEMAWVASLAAGLGALLMLDRRDRVGDVAACVLLVLSLSSSGLGVAIVIGVLVDVLINPPRTRRLWVVAVPIALYAAWYLGYSEPNFAWSRITQVPLFVADAFAASLSGLTGLTGDVFPKAGGTLDWGRPLAVVAICALAWRLSRGERVPARFVTLLATILAFWVLTAVSRAGVKVGGYSLAPPYASRYVYVGGFFVVLIAVELLRRVRLGPAAAAVLCVALLAGVVAHMGAFRDAGRYLRNNATILTTNLGAIEIARDRVPPDYLVAPYTRAGDYLAAAAEDGSPARTPDEIVAAPEKQRAGADFVLTQVTGVGARPGGGSRTGGARPTVEASAAGRLSSTDSCVSLRAGGFNAPWVKPELDLLVPAGGLVLTAEDGPVDLTVRRFAERFPRTPLGVLRSGSTATLRIPPDRAPQPWHMQLLPAGSVSACGIG